MEHNDHAPGAGPALPASEEPLTAATVQGLKDQVRTDRDDFATYAAVAEGDKAFTTLRATLALHGFELHIVGDGEGGAAYMVHRWNQSRTLPDLAAVARFLDQVGGAHA